MNISVIVPAFNEQKLIVATLRSIRAAQVAFGERGWETELLVCDNNSTDETVARAQEAGAVVMSVKRQGKGFVLATAFDRMIQQESIGMPILHQPAR